MLHWLTAIVLITQFIVGYSLDVDGRGRGEAVDAAASQVAAGVAAATTVRTSAGRLYSPPGAPRSVLERSRSVGRRVTRGEIWLTHVGRKSRPVLVLTRPLVIDVRQLVTVAEVTTSIRGIAAEVEFDHIEVGLDEPSVINCDGLHTVAQSSLSTFVGVVGDDAMERVCAALGYSLGCS